MEGKYLITTDDWFLVPDGQSYKAAWGEVSILQDSLLGVKTNSRSTNWYAKIGNDSKHIIVAGCQIHYAVKCDKKPKQHKHISEIEHEGVSTEHKGMTRIYIAE